MSIEKIVYTAHGTATGGRQGVGRSSDGAVDVTLAVPPEMGGPGGGANPEQLFAVGYAACFIGALKFTAGQNGIKLGGEVSIDSSVGIGPIPTGFGIQVELKIHLPGLEPDVAHDLIQKAHIVCPYSNATRGNIDVTLTLV